MSRWQDFSPEEQILLAVGLGAVWQDLQTHIETRPQSAELRSWVHSQRRAAALQDELGAEWAAKSRS